MLERIDLRERRARLEPRRFEADPSVADAVRSILARVRDEGDNAVLDLTLRFDGADLRERGLVATPDELEAAGSTLSFDLRHAIDGLVERLRDLHGRQLPREWQEEHEGVLFGEIVRPVEAAGCYVPGGRAVYPSSVAMTVVPAVIAGVPRVVVCTPPAQDGSLDPAVLYAATRAGAAIVVKAGGAQAIAALAFGTRSVPGVDRVVGPGNRYVTEAKRQVSGFVGVDGLAGPTELVLIADASADPLWVAIDLLAQAEHDPDAVTTLIVTDETVLAPIEQHLEAEARRSTRRGIVEKAFGNARVVLVTDADHAIEVANDLAPEHLQIVVGDPVRLGSGIRNAGAVFVGAFAAVPFGDYGVTSNHVLPTAGTARFASGLRASDFVKVMSVVELDRSAAERFAPEVSTIARHEGLDAHARAVEVRTKGRRPGW
ncbi:MAG TPA: histidinol dehydrogenase [Actinomycetota bacterium]